MFPLYFESLDTVPVFILFANVSFTVRLVGSVIVAIPVACVFIAIIVISLLSVPLAFPLPVGSRFELPSGIYFVSAGTIADVSILIFFLFKRTVESFAVVPHFPVVI